MSEKVISWSLMKDLIRKFHICPFCFKHMTGEAIMYEIGARKHPEEYRSDIFRTKVINFPVFAVHNYCPIHGCLTGDCVMRVRDGLEETLFSGAIHKAAELGWVVDWES